MSAPKRRQLMTTLSGELACAQTYRTLDTDFGLYCTPLLPTKDNYSFALIPRSSPRILSARKAGHARWILTRIVDCTNRFDNFNLTPKGVKPWLTLSCFFVLSLKVDFNILASVVIASGDRFSPGLRCWRSGSVTFLSTSGPRRTP